jgi:hypothetical protein
VVGADPATAAVVVPLGGRSLPSLRFVPRRDNAGRLDDFHVCPLWGFSGEGPVVGGDIEGHTLSLEREGLFGFAVDPGLAEQQVGFYVDPERFLVRFGPAAESPSRPSRDLLRLVYGLGV